MKSRFFSRWDSWKRDAIASAETLALQSGEGRLPIRLFEIASLRKVRDVIFRPLLLDGCLGVRSDGFVIFVLADKRRTDELKKAWRGGGTLPPRTRFTIAHEIAHTFFYDIETYRPRTDIDLTVPQTMNSLEIACNEVAAHMLLPDQLLLNELPKLNVLDPAALRRFARRAGVSTSMLTVRLKQSVDWSGKLGAILCVQQEAEGASVISKAMHYALRPHLGTDREETALTELIPDRSFVMNGGKKHEVIYPLSCRIGNQRATQELVWRCEKVEPKLDSQYFVTVKRKGDLQLCKGVA